MNRFPILLKTILERDPRSGLSIAAEIDISGPTLSRICSGVSVLDPETLAKVLKLFPRPEQRRRLIAAWIEDRAEEAGITPAELRASLETIDGGGIPAHLRPGLNIILARAGDSPEFAAAIDALVACLLSPQDRAEWMRNSPFPEFQNNEHQGVAEDENPPAIPPRTGKPASYISGRRKK